MPFAFAFVPELTGTADESLLEIKSDNFLDIRTELGDNHVDSDITLGQVDNGKTSVPKI